MKQECQHLRVVGFFLGVNSAIDFSQKNDTMEAFRKEEKRVYDPLLLTRKICK
jgi:hypothetical protein